MSRRRRRPRNNHRRKAPNYWLILVQVFVLAGVLVFLFMFRDYLAVSASSVVDSFGTGDDLDVPAQQEDSPNQRPDGQPALESPAQPGGESETDAQK